MVGRSIRCCRAVLSGLGAARRKPGGGRVGIHDDAPTRTLRPVGAPDISHFRGRAHYRTNHRY